MASGEAKGKGMGSSRQVLVVLLGCAIGAAGLIQGWHWRESGEGSAYESLKEQLRIAMDENEVLRQELEDLQKSGAGYEQIEVPKELLERLEKEYGYRFQELPVVLKLTSKELRDRVEAAIESSYGPAGVEDRQEAYRRIGWLKQGEELLPQLVGMRVVGAKTWFDDDTGEAWVTEEFDLENIPDQCALYAMLVRGMIWEKRGGPQAYGTDDERVANEGLAIGVAMAAESRMTLAIARSTGFLSVKENAEAKQLLLTAAPYVREIALFGGRYGKGMAEALYVQGVETLDGVLKKGLQSTQEVMTGKAGEEVPEMEILGADDEPYFSQRSGQIGLQLWIDGLGDGGGEELAKAWKNDRFILLPDGEEGLAVVWEVQMKEAGAAERLWDLGKKRVGKLLDENGKRVMVSEIEQAADQSWVKWERVGEDRVRFIRCASKGKIEELQKKAKR